MVDQEIKGLKSQWHHCLDIHRPLAPAEGKTDKHTKSLITWWSFKGTTTYKSFSFCCFSHWKMSSSFSAVFRLDSIDFACRKINRGQTKILYYSNMQTTGFYVRVLDLKEKKHGKKCSFFFLVQIMTDEFHRLTWGSSMYSNKILWWILYTGTFISIFLLVKLLLMY